jgi:hypothetical protein
MTCLPVHSSVSQTAAESLPPATPPQANFTVNAQLNIGVDHSQTPGEDGGGGGGGGGGFLASAVPIAPIATDTATKVAAPTIRKRFIVPPSVTSALVAHKCVAATSRRQRSQ